MASDVSLLAGDISTNIAAQRTALMERRESVDVLAATPPLRMALLCAAALADRLEAFRADLGAAAAELPPPLAPETAGLARDGAPQTGS